MPAIVVYSRRGCHLCEVLIEALLPIVRGRLPVTVRDIDTRSDWRARFDERVPVVVFEDRVVCEGVLDPAAVEALLAAAAPEGAGRR